MLPLMMMMTVRAPSPPAGATLRPFDARCCDCCLTDCKAGSALYPAAALFNHSCMPNVAYKFNCKQAEFYAIRTIEPGEQLYISYTDLYVAAPAAPDAPNAHRTRTALTPHARACTHTSVHTHAYTHTLTTAPHILLSHATLALVLLGALVARDAF